MQMNQGRRDSGFLLSEASGTRSRGNGILAQSATQYEPGTVLKFAANKYSVALAAETAVAILLNGTNATAGDVKVALIMRDAEINGAEIVYAADVDNPAKIATKATQLASLGIIVR